MMGLSLLVLLAVGLFALIAGSVVLLAAIKAVLWLVLLPFRLLFGFVLLPLLLIKLLVGGILLLIVGPVVLVALAIAAFTAVVTVVATGAALLVPLFPLLCIGFVVWAVMRSGRPAVA